MTHLNRPIVTNKQVIGQKLQQQLSLSPNHSNFNQQTYLKSLISPTYKKQAVSPAQKPMSEH